MQRSLGDGSESVSLKFGQSSSAQDPQTSREMKKRVQQQLKVSLFLPFFSHFVCACMCFLFFVFLCVFLCVWVGGCVSMSVSV